MRIAIIQLIFCQTAKGGFSLSFGILVVDVLIEFHLHFHLFSNVLPGPWPRDALAKASYDGRWVSVAPLLKKGSNATVADILTLKFLCKAFENANDFQNYHQLGWTQNGLWE